MSGFETTSLETLCEGLPKRARDRVEMAYFLGAVDLMNSRTKRLLDELKAEECRYCGAPLTPARGLCEDDCDCSRVYDQAGELR